VTYQSDIELAEDFKKGDQRAFKEVFGRFYRPLLLFAISIVHNEQEAEDIVAGTMTKLWKIHQNFDSLVNIRAFLYITVRNQCFNFLEREKVKSRYTTEAKYLQQGESEKFVLEWMVEMELLEMIRREIDGLSPQRRMVLTLSFFENMSNREIADKMQLSVNTIEATKTRAIQQLKIIIFKKKLFAVLLLFLAFIMG
jgi:RNA polymerase sigma-70 factor (family 1)